MNPGHTVVRTTQPHAVALQAMARTAIAASRVWSIRELASRIATRAPARDYVRQLEAIYAWMTARWRYVMEPDEFVHGTADSMIKHVIGTKYNAPGLDPTKVDLDALPLREHGWGDCDDVSTAVAALVIAIGMKALFRIAQSNKGAHVSVVARTPRGQFISLDPVGYPEHPFGWKLPAPNVSFYNIETGQLVR